MEWEDEAGQTQESARGGARTVGRLGPQRGQAYRQSRQWSQGRAGQKPQEDVGCAAQRAAAATRAREEVIDTLIAASRARFGDAAIGLGAHGIRFARASDAHTA
jgi:uncharacterized membrane protein YebE (DUF533 family)